jgi:hypothetical protein
MTSVHSRIWMLPVLAIATLPWHGSVLAAEVGDDALVKEAGAACQIASELDQARVLWGSPSFQTHAALIVTGTAPAAAGKDAERVYLLCLYDKQEAKVELQPIEARLFK